MTPLVIFGSGGMGREALAIVRAMNEVGGDWGFLGFVADWPEDLDAVDRAGSAFIGTPEQAVAAGLVPGGTHYAVGVGDSAARARIDARLSGLGWQAASLIHPAATVGPDVLLGPGSIVCPAACITTSVRIGRGSIVNVAASVHHDASLGEFVTLSPHAAVLGRARVGDRSTIHSAAVVLPRVRVGRDCVAGAGAVVLNDVPDGSVVVGVPARPRSP